MECSIDYSDSRILRNDSSIFVRDSQIGKVTRATTQSVASSLSRRHIFNS